MLGGAQRDNAPSRANFRQIMANLIIMHPAETEEIVLQAYSLRASRVQAYRCYELLWGYRAEHGQIQECYRYVRKAVETYLQSLAGISCIS